MQTDYDHLVRARQLAAGVARASMSHAFAAAIVAGRQDDNPAIQQIVEALRTNDTKQGDKTDD